MPLTLRSTVLTMLTTVTLFAYILAIIAYKDGDKSDENKRIILIGTIHLFYLLILFMKFTFNLIKK